MSDYAPIRKTYSTGSPVWARDLLKAETHGVLLNGDLLLATYTDGIVPSGAVIAVVTAAGATQNQGAPYDDTKTNGQQVATGHLVNELRVAAGGRYHAAVLHAGTVTRRYLPSNSGMDNAAKADLTAVTYI